MRGYSPKLILGKEVHSLYCDHIDDVRSSPRFYSAVSAAAEWVLSQYSSSESPYYSKYMGDVANVLMETSAIYFHLLKEYEDEGAGATLGKLQLVAFVHGYASPRRVTMYVKRLVHDGRLTYSTNSQDRRVRRLVPCEPLLATARQNIAGVLSPASILWPSEISPAAGVLWPQDDPHIWDSEQLAYFDRHFLHAGKLYVSGADPLRPFGDVRHFTAKDAGSYLLFSLILASMQKAGVPDPETRFPLSYSDAAAHTGVSRTHVRNVIEGAAERGLIADLGEGGRSMRLTPKLIDAFDRYFACVMILTRLSAKAAARFPLTGTERGNAASA